MEPGHAPSDSQPPGRDRATAACDWARRAYGPPTPTQRWQRPSPSQPIVHGPTQRALESAHRSVEDAGNRQGLEPGSPKETKGDTP